jgi:hypothetical protein
MATPEVTFGTNTLRAWVSRSQGKAVFGLNPLHIAAAQYLKALTGHPPCLHDVKLFLDDRAAHGSPLPDALIQDAIALDADQRADGYDEP